MLLEELVRCDPGARIRDCMECGLEWLWLGGSLGSAAQSRSLRKHRMRNVLLMRPRTRRLSAHCRIYLLIKTGLQESGEVTVKLVSFLRK